VVIQQGLGGMFQIKTTCPACRGRGQIITEKCETCRGKGRVPKQRRLSVRIPAGIRDGQAVRVSGEGEPPPPEVSPDGSGMRGDLHVVVRVEEHEFFERDGDNLVMALPLTIAQATLGADLEVPTLEGSEKVNVKKGTQHGELIRLRHKGLPNLRSGSRGDIALITRIEVPKKLTEKQEKLLREFAETEGDHSIHLETHGFWNKVKDFLGR
jgi:molecular chaperone DnaJ